MQLELWVDFQSMHNHLLLVDGRHRSLRCRPHSVEVKYASLLAVIAVLEERDAVAHLAHVGC